MTLTVIGRGVDAKMLASALGCRPNNRRADIGIRYGIRKLRHRRFRPFTIEINNDEAVARSSNKYGSLKLLKKVGLPVPNTSIHAVDIKYPMLGRDFYHSKGTDIKFIKDDTTEDWQSDYFVEYIKPRNEYRVHVVFGNVINIAVKINGNREAVCRNLETGWVMNDSKNWENLCPKLPEIACKAVNCLGLDFGAVDILLSEDKKPYILEVNTAPGLIERRAILYANAIKTHIQSR